MCHLLLPGMTVFKSVLEVWKFQLNVDLIVFVLLRSCHKENIFVNLVCWLDGKQSVQTELRKFNVSIKTHNFKKGVEIQKSKINWEKVAKIKIIPLEKLKKDSLGVSISTQEIFSIIAFQNSTSTNKIIKYLMRTEKQHLSKEHCVKHSTF